jgi:hypothetical protein
MFGSIDMGPYLESSDSLGCVDIYRGRASRKIDVEIEKTLLVWRDMYESKQGWFRFPWFGFIHCCFQSLKVCYQ